MNIQRTTSHGTPWASTWDDAWAERVEAAESALDRRICGARTLSGEPCPLASNHATGRCRYHGGTDAIGAPIGNQNARTHGLYARRLQRCGTHCPMWDHCPFAGDDVLALEHRDRPVCAYEADEYESILRDLSDEHAGRDALPRVHESESGPAGAHPSHSIESEALRSPSDSVADYAKPIHHNLALMHVMLSRAAAALSVTTLTDTTLSEGEHYSLQSTKLHPAVQAFLRISRELRAMQSQFQLANPRATRGSTGPVQRGRGSNPTVGDVEAPVEPTLWNRDPAMYAEANAIMKAAWEEDGQREEYTRRLEWIAHDHLGEEWREFESIREFAVPRGKRNFGLPTHDRRLTTHHPPPNDHPAPLIGNAYTEDARAP